MGPEINDRYVQRDAVIDMEMFQRGVTRLPSVLRRFGFDSMREGQDKVVYALLAGQDLLAVLPTSMGKTFCFQAATLALEWKTLVFSPLIALMRDQVQQAVARGFRVASITSHNTNALNQMAVASWVRGELDFLYVAPERLRSDEFIEAMRLVPPDMIAVDEVHCLSAWSDTFRSAFLQIGDFITNHRPRVVSAFTATCPPKVEADIRRVLCLEKARKAIHYPRRQNLDLRSSPFLGFESMFNILSRPIDGSAVVYCVSRKNTEIVAQALQQALPDKRVMFYHGGMKPPERSSVQDDFARGDIDIICATNAFGMGVDKSNVRVVLHRDIASSMEGQSQEDGRAGRDGKYSLCQTLFDSESIRTHEFMIRTSCPLFKEVKAVYEVMQTAKDPTGQVSMSSEDIAKRLRLHSKSMGPILQILAGALVIERSAAITKRWRFRFENLIDDPEFMNFKEIVDTVGEVDGDMLSCRMEEMSDMTGLSDAVLKNRFTKWSSSGLLTCDKPDRSAPIKLIGNIKSVDANRTDNLRKIAQAKLEEVIVYARDVPDAAKHDYVETCMNTKGWEAKA